MLSYGRRTVFFICVAVIVTSIAFNMRPQTPSTLLAALPLLPLVNVVGSNSNTSNVRWYPPRQSEINSLPSAINGSGVYGFVFDSSQNPAGVPYGTYNWCNMPHVRPQEYRIPARDYRLAYVEVIHRHHKRTPYASNTFPVESYPWYCNESALYFYGTANSDETGSARTFWRSYGSDVNPFQAAGFQGNCQFPQITKEGLDDSWQHGRDLYAVYHKMLGLIPDDAASSEAFSFRVTNNVITSQVAGMLINGMFGITNSYPLLIQPDTVDSLEPRYSCPAASRLFSSYGVASVNPNWTAHLTASQPLFDSLDGISGVHPADAGWHRSWDHYFDNLSARLCHDKSLPCNVTDPSQCITRAQADQVFRLGQYEYSYIYRDTPQSLEASAASFGVWIAELAEHLRAVSNSSATTTTRYEHNVAHDGSLSRLLSVLQLDNMVWPGMGAEVVFELYERNGGRHARGRGARGSEGEWYVRILWGGQPLQSSHPRLGTVDMLPLEDLLAYLDDMVGRRASLVEDRCAL